MKNYLRFYKQPVVKIKIICYCIFTIKTAHDKKGDTMWQKSNLKPGQRMKIQEKMFVVTGDRFIKAEYMQDTPHGILLRFFFEPGPCTEDKKWYYDFFISWVSLFCGDVKLQTEDGKDVRAIRLFN